jgi:hypothetical protein
VGLGVVAVSSPPSSSLWKCGNPRLVRVSKLGGTGNNLRPRFRFRSHRAPFPQRTRNSAHFGANVVVGSCTRPKCAFPETRTERTFLQIVVQSPFLFRWTQLTDVGSMCLHPALMISSASAPARPAVLINTSFPPITHHSNRRAQHSFFECRPAADSVDCIASARTV